MNFSLLRKLALPVCLLCVSFTSSYGQTESEDPDHIFFVQIDKLDAYSYGDIARSLKGESQLEIVQSCVPAELVQFKHDSAISVDQAFENLQGLVMSQGLDLELKMLPDYDLEAFRNACLSVRRGFSPDQN